jgi:hypothetical protein
MANNSLSVFNNDGLELVIDTNTGEAFATQSGYARMSGKDRTTIVKRCQGCEPETIKKAEIITAGGLQGCELIPAKIVFRWLMKDNPELAEKMGTVGATVYLHQLAGYKVKSEPVEQPKPELPPSDIRVVQIVSTLEKIGLELNNPRFNQALKDLACDILGLNQNRLPAAENKEVWCGVAERAEQLGYPVAAVTRFRSPLGKFVKNKGLVSKMEKRLCGGTEREINLYQVCERLDNSIHAYMKTKFLP